MSRSIQDELHILFLSLKRDQLAINKLQSAQMVFERPSLLDLATSSGEKIERTSALYKCDGKAEDNLPLYQITCVFRLLCFAHCVAAFSFRQRQ